MTTTESTDRVTDFTGAGETVSAERVAWRSRAWRAAILGHRYTVGTPLAGRRALPDFVIAGAQRAGTTSLYRYLLEHPRVAWPRFVKGVHYFDVDYARAPRWYRSHFPLERNLRRDDPARRRVTGEASPYYLFHPHVPQRLAETVPDVRVIAILRDPVARALSHYAHERARGFEPLDLADALDVEERRLTGEERRLADPAYRSFSHQHHSYVARGRYIAQLDRYREVLPSQQLLVLDADDLLTDTQHVFDRVCRFLGIGQHTLDTPRRFNARPKASVRGPVRSRLVAAFRDDVEGVAELLGHRPSWGTS
jgi:hypothetical protein